MLRPPASLQGCGGRERGGLLAPKRQIDKEMKGFFASRSRVTSLSVPAWVPSSAGDGASLRRPASRRISRYGRASSAAFWRHEHDRGSQSDSCYRGSRRRPSPFCFSKAPAGGRQGPAPCFVLHRRHSSGHPSWPVRSRSTPPAAMRPNATSSSARARFFSDHLLVDCRGVNRISQCASSKRSSWPSIQPWQSAASTASSLEIPAIPDDFFAILSQRPLQSAGCDASHVSKARCDLKARTGKSRDGSAMNARRRTALMNPHSARTARRRACLPARQGAPSAPRFPRARAAPCPSPPRTPRV